jgi:hypothetical protein
MAEAGDALTGGGSAYRCSVVLTELNMLPGPATVRKKSENP